MSQVVRFKKIVPEGKAMGYLADGRAVFCIGPLPEETARINLRKQKRTYAEATLREILEPSTKRSDQAEDHALICSPWQGVDYAYQCQLKTDMITEAMRQHHLEPPNLAFVAAPDTLGYRNRLDFSVARIEGSLQLAFHQRGSWDTLVPLPHGCKLGSQLMNSAALNLIAQLAKLDVEITPAMITVRHARTSGELLTILTTGAKAVWKTLDTAELGRLVVARPLSGSGAPGDITYHHGDSFITERLAGVSIAYPYNSFFQANTPVFEQALEQIMGAAKGAKQIIELYSGVGAIGLPLAAAGHQVHGIELVPAAVEFAERNARANGIVSYKAETVAAERMDATVLADADTIILDPPRAGLHPRVIGWLLAAQPQRIIYLSCNPVTQARDLALLQDDYKIKSLTGFDFYPGTLHLESLAVLKR
jgi:23S rRNA (uracil1939-C5)-methyltransferase